MSTTTAVTWDASPSVFGGLGAMPTIFGSRPAAKRAAHPKYPDAGTVAAVEFADSDLEQEQVEVELHFADVLALNSPHFYQAGSPLMREIDPRLRELQSQFIDDHDQEISRASIFALRSLLASIPGLRKPTLSAEPSGNLIATWRKGTDSLSVRLLHAVELHFAFGGTARGAGGNADPRYGRSAAATLFAESSEARQIAC